MRLEPGMRVRCVDGYSSNRLTRGKEYMLTRVRTKYVGVVDDNGEDSDGWLVERFKPIVRVKAPSRKGCCNKGCAGCPDFAFRARLHRFATSGDRI